MTPKDERARVFRTAGRLLVVDDDGSVLLFHGRDPARPTHTFWFTPGGSVKDDESTSDAARRELKEETGLLVTDLGPVVMERTWEFDFDGVAYRQAEQYFWVRSQRFVLDSSAWSDVERRSLFGHRWWSAPELVATPDTIYPEGLARLLTELITGSRPK